MVSCIMLILLIFPVIPPLFSDVYTFNIEPESNKPHPIDSRIAATIAHILKLFFAEKQRAMLMVCDNLDGKEEKRKILFSRWFLRYNDGNIRKYDASAITEDYNFMYQSIYIKRIHTCKKRCRLFMIW